MRISVISRSAEFVSATSATGDFAAGGGGLAGGDGAHHFDMIRIGGEQFPVKLPQ